jgi:hypothetical protein
MADLDRLRFHVEKRLQTTMIGSLSKFEDTFGFLWGHNVENEEDLTTDQIEFADIWETTRNQILNQGNAQIRNIKEDFYKYGGLFRQTYNYNFKAPPAPTNQTENNCGRCDCSKNK